MLSVMIKIIIKAVWFINPLTQNFFSKEWHPSPAFLPGKSTHRGVWSMGSQRVRHNLATKQQQIATHHLVKDTKGKRK